MALGKVRDKSKEAFWRRTVREQRQSGLTVRAFCHKHGVHESAFYFWRRKLERRGAAQAASAAFLPVRVAVGAAEVAATGQGATPALGGGHIEIMLECGRRVHVAPPVDRQALADVLAVLSDAGPRRGEDAAGGAAGDRAACDAMPRSAGAKDRRREARPC